MKHSTGGDKSLGSDKSPVQHSVSEGPHKARYGEEE